MSTTRRYPADAVFEGGGVTGIALIGALSVMEETWAWENVAGTSAGAIVAAFTAVGKPAHEIDKILGTINLTELMDTGWEEKVDWLLSRLSPIRLIPGVGMLREHIFSVIKDFGIYEGDRFTELVNDNLPPGIRNFGDILYDPDLPKDHSYRYKLRVVASDITANRMLVLPQDIRHFGRDPDKLPIAEALRMSMSIPIFFEPWRLTDAKGKVHFIVDGGILSNYPIWMFDAPIGTDPPWPTFGFDLYRPADKADGHLPFPQDVDEVKHLFDFGKSIWDTLFSAMDRRHIPQRHWARTIAIDNCNISTTQFDLSPDDEKQLRGSGVRAARDFMSAWGDPVEGFRRWRDQYRHQVEEAQSLAAHRYT